MVSNYTQNLWHSKETRVKNPKCAKKIFLVTLVNLRELASLFFVIAYLRKYLNRQYCALSVFMQIFMILQIQKMHKALDRLFICNIYICFKVISLYICHFSL